MKRDVTPLSNGPLQSLTGTDTTMVKARGMDGFRSLFHLFSVEHEAEGGSLTGYSQIHSQATSARLARNNGKSTSIRTNSLLFEPKMPTPLAGVARRVFNLRGLHYPTLSHNAAITNAEDA